LMTPSRSRKTARCNAIFTLCFPISSGRL
jgi:hypothetical protein